MNVKWRWNSCRGQRQNISLLASGALPAAEQSSARGHLAQCVECRRYYEEIVELSGEFKQWASAQRAAESHTGFRARWMRSVKDLPDRSSLRGLISRGCACLWPSPLAWGALAVVWICLLSLQWATPRQPSTAQELAKKTVTPRVITLAQRQRELSSLLDSLLRTPTASQPESPRPRSERQMESVNG
jgi:anti-sigma factor RsiW